MGTSGRSGPSTTAGWLVAAAALVLAGCSVQVPGSGSAASGAAGPPGGAVAERPVLASARAVVAGPAGVGVEIQVDLNEVRANGRLMQVTFTAHNLAPAEEPP